MAAGALGPRAEVSVILDQPGASRESGDPFLLKPRVEGAGAASGYHLAVAENGRLLARFTWPVDEPSSRGPGGLRWTGMLVGPEAGVDLALNQDGALVLTADCPGAARTFQVRATASGKPSAFRTVTVQVTPRTGPAAPAAETKAAAGAAAQAYVWDTPFSLPGQSGEMHGFTWDPTTATPSIVAWVGRDLVRCRLDGKHQLLVPGHLPELGLKPNFLAGIAVTAAGAIVFADPAHHRILQLDPDRTLRILAGTGKAGFGEHLAADGNLETTPARQTDLYSPATICAQADGSLVFWDSFAMKISRITPDGRIEPLAGRSWTAAGAQEGTQDLSLVHPAQTFKLPWQTRLAAAPLPDGTLVFTLDNNGIAALAPDGTVVNLPHVHDHTITCLTVTAEGEIVFTDTLNNLWLLDRDGRSTHLVLGDFTHRGLSDHAPARRQPDLVAAGQARFGPATHLEAVPGGILVNLQAIPQVLLIGPRHADHLLVEQVELARAAVARGDLDRARRSLASLQRYAKANIHRPGTLAVPQLATLARPYLPSAEAAEAPGATRAAAPGGALRNASGQPLPEVAEGLIGLHLEKKFPALALRARIAIHLLDRRMRKSHPEAWAKLVAPAAAALPAASAAAAPAAPASAVSPSSAAAAPASAATTGAGAGGAGSGLGLGGLPGDGPAPAAGRGTKRKDDGLGETSPAKRHKTAQEESKGGAGKGDAAMDTSPEP